MKKVKDPNAPKKGMTAFLHFVQSQSPVFKKEFPTLAHKDIISKMGHNWKTLTTEQKATYEAKAKGDKERYEREKKAYAAKKE